MRFSNAAGFKESMNRRPWYSSGEQNAAAPDAMPEKNVWGNEDPLRREREQARMTSNDPLVAMKRGLSQLKASKEQKKRLNEEKQKQLNALRPSKTSDLMSRREVTVTKEIADTLTGIIIKIVIVVIITETGVEIRIGTAIIHIEDRVTNRAGHTVAIMMSVVAMNIRVMSRVIHTVAIVMSLVVRKIHKL
ncbi:hypothetical protein N7468_004328 [Penicillium chermesinum]|uniref:Uncharacterized protein n=1 Tax=Penicillium chermesinum TaxID=63820 RepID=A0A9W9TU82_9EURO|nr:uncharacterized protein N7468_004328 [Penicillium chermesinum]KAJ5239709.1 hypothetical protein N7468_004328 [Penicillium chermesinum]